MPGERVGNIYDFHSDESTIFSIAFIFLTGALLLIVLLFGSRIRKSYRQKRIAILREQFQKILNAIVINETFSQKSTPVSAFEYRMAELRLLMGTSSFARQLLITQILNIKKNLSGSSSMALVATYYGLELHQHSLRKLNSWEWKRKALGIRELAEMGYRESVWRISKFLNARNPTLKEESFMALVRLEQHRPLFFLDNYQQELTPWMRLNIFSFLQKLDPRKLPDFSRWFTTQNLSVCLFSISMARQFRQTSALPSLVQLLSSSNHKIIGITLETLGELEAYQYRENVLELHQRAQGDEKLSRRYVRCLGRIGDPLSDVEKVGEFLNHPSYEVRFEAALALKNMGEGGETFIRNFNQENKQKLDGLMRHLSEPLLQ